MNTLVTPMTRRTGTRKALRAKIQELEARIAATSGETRSNLRRRLARLSKENGELKTQLESAKGQVTFFQGKVAELEAKMPKEESENKNE